MIFKSIFLKEGMSARTINFTDGVNLIHSQSNSRGKTTLLRFMLYGLGYNIPDTKNIKFDRCEVKCTVENEQGEFVVSRWDTDFMTVRFKDKEITYMLPEELHKFHSILFGTENADTLNNLLGAFYLDQEKGWTLLNRGKVIGSNSFNIEELIRGLSERNCDELIAQKKQQEKELSRYKQLFNIAEYRNKVIAEKGSLVSEKAESKADIELEMLMMDREDLEKELHRIESAIKDNESIAKFLSEMKIMVSGPNDTVIPVTVDNIIGFSDNMDYLQARKKILRSQLVKLTRKIEHAHKEIVTSDEQLSFYKSESALDVFDLKVAKLPIDSVALKKQISRLESSLRETNRALEVATKYNNPIITELHKNITRYANELGLDEFNEFKATYLFTSNLKELSGAVLHKTVFAFRLAYILEIQKILKIKLPIMLDSPSGKEVDHENVQLMMNILQRDFSENQIIIASIFEYDFPEVNVIEIKKCLIE